MKATCKILLGLLFGLLICNVTQGQNACPDTNRVVQEDTLFFQFAPGKLMFWRDYKGNRESIRTMVRHIQAQMPGIESGDMKVRVLGFCSSFGSDMGNLSAAKNRSNQVKSYLIVHEGLKEEHFMTTNSTLRWRGLKDVVAVTCMPGKEFPETPLTEEDMQDTVHSEGPVIPQEESPLPIPAKPAEESPSSSVQPENHPDNEEGHIPSVDSRPYRWAVKTNVAYLAATVANLGIEYSFGKHYSIDLPFIYSPYTVNQNYRLRFLAVQPEFRYWLGEPMKGHFFGAHLNIGAFNVSVNSRSRYQSPDGFYGIGVSYGYMLPFARHWAAEFTVGAGYVHTRYESFYNIPEGARYEQGVPYNYWGLTKVGIGLSYRFGK